MTLKLSEEHLNAIKSHGERIYPHECCGFLLGRADGEVREVVEVLPATNTRGEEEKHNRFTITPEASMKAEKAARNQQLDIIGHYHSHPDHPAEPSAYDLEHATWPGYSFAIVSIEEGQAKVVNSFELAHDRSKFNPEAIDIA